MLSIFPVVIPAILSRGRCPRATAAICFLCSLIANAQTVTTLPGSPSQPAGINSSPAPAPLAATLGGPLPGPFPLFPGTNWWNLDISGAPVDPNSAAFIGFIGPTRQLHPDFGGDVSPGSTEIYGLPYIVVDAAQAKKAVQFFYSTESDGVDHSTNQSFPFYPIPDDAITQVHWIEEGYPGNVDRRSVNDRHMLIVDRDNKYLYELFNVFYNGTQWLAGSGAFFDMKTNNRRPEGWTSADAAGLAILPGLVRYDEVFGPDEIQHAFRVTLRASNGYVYPASHSAGSNPQALPMGARLRLKASKDISGFPPEAQKIFRAMKRYGLMMADNGSDMYVTGTYDTRWNNGILNPAFAALTASDFDVVQLGYAPPVLASVSPGFGPIAGGTLVTVSGANFVTGASLSIGGVAATGVTVVNSTTITGTTGAHAAGVVDVVVTNPDAQTGTLTGGFTYSTGAAFFTVTPCRLADTRNPPGPSGGPALSANSGRTFPVSGLCSIPGTAKAVAVIVVAVAPSDSGDIRLFPAGGTAPITSAINFRLGLTRANNAVIPLGTSGQVSAFCDMPVGSTGSTHFVIDVYGYFQ